MILNTFESTNTAVIDPLALSAYQSGNNQWIMGGTAGSVGFTDLTFYYSDGLDTL